MLRNITHLNRLDLHVVHSCNSAGLETKGSIPSAVTQFSWSVLTHTPRATSAKHHTSTFHFIKRPRSQGSDCDLRLC